MNEALYIVTGGPGAGKSTLVEALAAQGIACMPESGRAVIRDQLAAGGDALPWADRARFAEQMVARDLQSWRAARASRGPVVFDRGIPDILGYLTLVGLPASDALRRAVGDCRYRSPVFLAPHWPAIFHQDEERRQDAAEAEATCRVMAEVYTALGYTVVTLPCASVAERIAFVCETIGEGLSVP